MAWLFAYLLFGFVVSWCGTHLSDLKPNPNGWRWELAATILWPLTVILAICGLPKKRHTGDPVGGSGT